MNTLTTQTNHFQRERMQQRGIPTEFPDLAALYGDVFPRDTTTNAIYFSKRSISRMISKGVASRLIREVESRPNVRFLISKDSGAFITVYYAHTDNRRIKKDIQSNKRIHKLH